MSSDNVQMLNRLLGIDRLDEGSEVDMVELFADPEAEARIQETIAPDAVIEFATPDGGSVGDMAGPFRGPEGLRTGWLEWLEPWESFIFRRFEWIDVGDGRYLTLGDSVARMTSGVEVETPVGALYTIEGGRVTRIQHFLDQAQARRAAGLDPRA